MRKSWPFAVAVIVVGGLAGLAIAGRPVPADSFVLDPGVTVPPSPSSTSVVVPTTSIAEPATTTPVTAITTTVATASTTVAATTAAPTTTDAPATTDAPTTTLSGPLARNKVRLVIANGDGRFKLASSTADRIRSLGYVIDLGDTLNRVGATVIYYRPDFQDEAEVAAGDIGVPDAIITAFPTKLSQPITDSDDRGDVIIVLGPDAPR
jgi:hypothetical protein